MTDKKKSKKSKSGKDKKKQPKRRTFKGRSFTSNEFTGIQPYAGVARGMNYRGPYRGWAGGAGGGIIGERAPATKVVQDPKLVEQVADLKASLFIAQARAKFAGEHAATKTAHNLDQMQKGMAKTRKKKDKASKERIQSMGGEVSKKQLEELQDRLHDNLFVSNRPVQYGTDMTTEASKSKTFEFGEPIPTKKEKKQASRKVDITEQEREELKASLQKAAEDTEMKVQDDEKKDRVIKHNHIHGRVVSRGGDRDNRDRFKNTTIKDKRQEQKIKAQKEQRTQKLENIRKGTLPEENIVQPDISASSARKRGNEDNQEDNQLYLMNGPVREREEINLNKVPRFSGPAMDMSLAAERRREIAAFERQTERVRKDKNPRDGEDRDQPLMITNGSNIDHGSSVAPEGMRRRVIGRREGDFTQNDAHRRNEDEDKKEAVLQRKNEQFARGGLVARTVNWVFGPQFTGEVDDDDY